MTSAAIYLNPEAFDTGGKMLMGRHSAGESFLRGYIKHARTGEFTFWNVADRPLERMNAFVQNIQATEKPIRWVGKGDRADLAHSGVVHLPTPALARQSWWRRPYGSSSYALCGITHTTAEHVVLDMVSNLMIAPVEPWDALICTSRAVRKSVETQLNATCAYLAERLGVTKFNSPMLETIPLGINTEEFLSKPAHRARWRRELGIPDDALVALYVGRFSREAKMSPIPMALALEAAAEKLGKPLYWVASGWAGTSDYAEQYHADVRSACPSVHYRVIDGRRADARFSIWSVADFFLSLSDNIQETYGLTPLEAMAAGLPCVVSDWDGYRETVRHGVDGFRIPTYCPPPGAGRDLAYSYDQAWIDYSRYVGSASQMTAVDLSAAIEAIVSLGSNVELRRQMGAAAQRHAQANLDWKALVPRYEELWREQTEQRLRSTSLPSATSGDPWRPDPFQTFASYPTEPVKASTTIALTTGMSWAKALERLSLSSAPYVLRFMPVEAELERLYDTIAAHPLVSVGDVVSSYPEEQRPKIARAILWLAKYGVLRLSGRAPPVESDPQNGHDRPAGS